MSIKSFFKYTGNIRKYTHDALQPSNRTSPNTCMIYLHQSNTVSKIKTNEPRWQSQIMHEILYYERLFKLHIFFDCLRLDFLSSI